jgi:hypothetical protein
MDRQDTAGTVVKVNPVGTPMLSNVKVALLARGQS